MKRAFASGDFGHQFRQTDASAAKTGGIFEVEDSQTTFTDGAGNKTWFVSTTAGNVAISLPPADEGTTKVYTVKRTTGGANTLTVTALSGNIDGAASHSITVQHKSYSYMSDGVDYWIVAVRLVIATAAEYRNNTADKILSTDQVWSAATEVPLTDAATIAVDMATFINAVVTLAGNRTLGQPSNTKVGQCGVIRIIQDGTGTRTLAYHADWKFAGGTDPVLSTPAASEDLLFYHVLAANKIFGSLVKAIA